jgi:hypothetical protein
MKATFLGLAVAAALALATSSASAAGILLATYSGTGTDGRAATAEFFNNGGLLEVVITNTMSPTAVHDPTSAVTSLFFNLTGAPTLTNTSVTAFRSITALDQTTGIPTISASSANFQTLWGPPTSLASGFNEGTGAAGNPGGGGSFGPVGYVGSTNINGVDGGILPNLGSATHYGGTGQNPISNFSSLPLAYTSVTLDFSLPTGYNLTASSLGASVQFGYGTAANEGSIVAPRGPVVPVPAAAWTSLSALASLGLFGKIRKKLQRD